MRADEAGRAGDDDSGMKELSWYAFVQSAPCFVRFPRRQDDVSHMILMSSATDQFSM